MFSNIGRWNKHLTGDAAFCVDNGGLGPCLNVPAESAMNLLLAADNTKYTFCPHKCAEKEHKRDSNSGKKAASIRASSICESSKQKRRRKGSCMSIREPGLLGKMSYRVLCLVFGSHQKREPAASGSRESKRGAGEAL